MIRLSPTALLTLAALGASAGPALAAGPHSPLTATLELADQWQISADAVTLDFTLTNDTDTRVRVLDWQTPLTTVDKQLFVVTRDGQPVPYIWRVVDYGTPQLEHFITLEPGETRAAVIPDLSRLYDMSEPGLYEVSFQVATIQGAFGQQAQLDRMQAGLLGELASNTVAFWWDGGEPRAARPSTTIEGYTACRPSKQQDLIEALDNAAMIADMAVDHLDANPTGSPLYEFWFGDYNLARFATVSDNYDAIADALNNEPVNFSCACKSPAYAYVYPNEPYNIYLCSAFWRAPAMGRDSKAGTLVHEMSHFNVVAGTDDIVYGASGAHNLAVSSPSQAIRNADNHEYFAEDQAQ